MTNDQDSSDTFQVVLIDIKKAAEWEIQCVKKPLTDQLKFVAISYRWGELQETIIDTGVGYLASITSFDLENFYRLCKAIRNEPTMGSMDYVWVDAICVNQTNHDERKATIYHMSEIYEHASWILAVPDLHAKHLKAMHSYGTLSVGRHKIYLYHLLHGYTNKLYDMDAAFLDKIGVPEDWDLRRLLTKYTGSFTNGFMEPVIVNYNYNPLHTIEHLYNLSQNKPSGLLQMMLGKTLRTQPGIEPPHQCDEVDCPLEYLVNMSKARPSQQYRSGEWGRHIIERRTAIHQAMYFLTALMVDWSSRVWVISEFHLAKKKNNLKFWFTQLNGSGSTFFTFDMNDLRFTRIKNMDIHYGRFAKELEPVYRTFYLQLFNQLNRQTFLEMMLKSKASKNEDRFYAIFPFFPQYKHLLQNEDLDNMNSILSVKLKLYQVMTNEHKLQLLYLSSSGTTTYILPTFATSTIDWPETDVESPKNIKPIDITLLYQETVGHYLRVKPAGYDIQRDTYIYDPAVSKALNRLLHPKTLRTDGSRTFVDIVKIYDTSARIVLFGSFIENTWILGGGFNMVKGYETVKDLADDFTGFHVY